MKKVFYGKINGKESYIYSIKGESLLIGITDYGAAINFIKFQDVDVALGFNTVSDYLSSRTYAGATIGRVANRIAGGRFLLNGRPYFLNKNDGENHLHGGVIGFDKKLYEVVNHNKNSITLHCTSLNGEERYPGNLDLTVQYTITGNCVEIVFKAKCDKTTLWSPTNHTYFNLDGENCGDCRNNLLQINADYYTPANSGLIPTGEKKAVSGTPFDFKKLKKISTDFGGEELKATNGYDHNYILNGEYAAHAESEMTGIKMDVYTDMPCLQLYTGGAINPCKGKTINYEQWAGFCLEPQFCPNAINANGFEKPILEQGKERTHCIRYEFKN